jgi:hypothetical protein
VFTDAHPEHSAALEKSSFGVRRLSTEKTLQDFSDEQLRAELQRRFSEISQQSSPTNESSSLLELPSGSWVPARGDPPSAGGSVATEYERIMRLALARTTELLAIPLDPTDQNYGAVLRGINSAVGTFMTFITKINDEMLRPPKDDHIQELIEEIKEFDKLRWDQKLPELGRELIKLSDEQIKELLAQRRHYQQWEQQTRADIRARLDKRKDPRPRSK